MMTYLYGPSDELEYRYSEREAIMTEAYLRKAYVSKVGHAATK